MARENWALYLFKLPLEEEIVRVQDRFPDVAVGVCAAMREFDVLVKKLPELTDERAFDRARDIFRAHLDEETHGGRVSPRTFLSTYAGRQAMLALGDVISRCGEKGYKAPPWNKE